MKTATERFAKEARPEHYFHGFHAGNVGDVWKHIALLSLLHSLRAHVEPLEILDCYAGAGGYKLPAVGEWTAGVGALMKVGRVSDPAVDRYLKLVGARVAAERFYPGSPLLIESQLREADSFHCFEIHPETCALLRNQVSQATKVSGHDGLSGLLRSANEAAASKSRLFALVDPPWIKKEDWQSIPRTIVEAWKFHPQAVLALWYPIKSYTRVNAMLKFFETQKLPAAVLDLITTPLELQKNRLNGSGMLVVNAPADMLAEAARAGVTVGQACSTHGSYWSARITELPR